MNKDFSKTCLVEFYGISNLVGYLIPNPIYTNRIKYRIYRQILSITSLKGTWSSFIVCTVFQQLLCRSKNLTSVICWHTVKWLYIYGGACDVMVIVVGNENSDTNSNPGRD